MTAKPVTSTSKLINLAVGIIIAPSLQGNLERELKMCLCVWEGGGGSNNKLRNKSPKFCLSIHPLELTFPCRRVFLFSLLALLTLMFFFPFFLGLFFQYAPSTKHSLTHSSLLRPPKQSRIGHQNEFFPAAPRVIIDRASEEGGQKRPQTDRPIDH